MHLDCKVSFVPRNGKHKFSRAKVGVGDKGGNGYLVVSSATIKERLPVKDISKFFLSKTRPLITINFTTLKKELAIECDDQSQSKALASALDLLRKGEPVTQKLPSLGHVVEMSQQRSNPSSLSVVGSNYDVRELANQSLQKVIFEGTKLLPKGVWKLSKLTELHLIKCSLTEFPERLVNLGATLTYLNLSNNSIKEMPGNLFTRLRNLRHLSVSHNELVVIPLQIVLLKNLVTLNISRNKLRKLPFTLSALSHLSELNISHNELQYLPLSLLKPTNCKFKPATFDFSGNHSSSAFLDRIRSWPTSPGFSASETRFPPSLLDRCASASLRSLENLKRLHYHLPATVYEYILLNTNLCSGCRRPCNGDIFIKQIIWKYDWSSFATTVIRDGPSTRLPVVAFNCWHCAVKKAASN